MLAALLLCCLFGTSPLSARGAPALDGNNYPDRRAFVLPVCTHVDLAEFRYDNVSLRDAEQFRVHLTWRNANAVPIVAFEIVILKYDAFDERMIGTRWVVSGRNGGDWKPLSAGQSNDDTIYDIGPEEVFTALAYVRKVRLANGTVWTANNADVIAEARKAVPEFKEFGSFDPDPKRTR